MGGWPAQLMAVCRFHWLFFFSALRPVWLSDSLHARLADEGIDLIRLGRVKKASTVLCPCCDPELYLTGEPLTWLSGCLDTVLKLQKETRYCNKTSKSNSHHEGALRLAANLGLVGILLWHFHIPVYCLCAGQSLRLTKLHFTDM